MVRQRISSAKAASPLSPENNIRVLQSPETLKRQGKGLLPFPELNRFQDHLNKFISKRT